ncbi:hypothetical protein NDU88_005718 [Pleurodeles waltl]|uniref:Uncharacterized protein n=1 Tax=Pleurodeles waltl TaxID=8319 RepID=A0AAV7W8U1_PLEWA|nr:hypothetical protein NDU88_005718 [Pleurodeles waltl]
MGLSVASDEIPPERLMAGLVEAGNLPPRKSVLLKVATTCWKNCLKRTGVAVPYSPELPLTAIPLGMTYCAQTGNQTRAWMQAGAATLGDLFRWGFYAPLRDK